MGTIGIANTEGMFVNKAGITGEKLALVAFVETLTHTGLLINNGIRMAQNIRETGAHGARVITVKRVLVEFDISADGVAQGFGRNCAPVSTTATDVIIAFDDRNSGPLFNQSHCGAFSARA